jgi:hypothetical protein
MKAYITRLMIVILFLLALTLPAVTAGAQAGDPLAPSQTPLPQYNQPAQNEPTDRPLVVIDSYHLNQDTIRPGDSFNLYVAIRNIGSQEARNLIFTFSGNDFLPKGTGGVKALATLNKKDHEGDSKEFSQEMIAGQSLWGQQSGTIGAQLTYDGPDGTPYSASFTITLEVLGWSGVSSTLTPTPTATSFFPRPQLVVSGYNIDTDPLQPGSIFTLDIIIRNLGNSDARNVTLVLGGGGTNIDPNGTPQPGGVSGSSGDTSIFAPIGSSNLLFLGDIPTGAEAKSSQKVIVNVSANPGAFTLKLSLVYNDVRGNRLVDDQVITLLVYQLPQVEVNFYRDPGMIFAMQPNQLPIQIVNLGRKSFVFGNMTVTTDNASLMNNTMLVGALEAGGYFPLDVMAIPNEAGLVELKISINYTDDFNQQRTIIQTLNLDVQEAPTDPGMIPGDPGFNPGGEFPGGEIPVAETVWDKIVRFFRGLFGLDSAPSQPANPEMPGEMPPTDSKPLPSGGKG